MKELLEQEKPEKIVGELYAVADVIAFLSEAYGIDDALLPWKIRAYADSLRNAIEGNAR